MKKTIEKLIKLVNYEREAEINLMINEIKKLSPSKREKLGRAINKVKGKYLGKELGYHIVQFGRRKIIDTEINVGDIVLISIGNPLKSNLTGTVTEIGNRYIKVAFENLPKWATKKEVRIDLYANDVTFKRMEDNLKNLSYKGKDALGYILKKRRPKEDVKLTNINFKDKNLNKSQKSAIEHSLGCQNFFLIHGPFGTGKTRTLIELIYQEFQQENKILATAESNNAVDNILERLSEYKEINITRLGHPQRISKENIKFSLAYKVENHPLNKKIEKEHKKFEELTKKRDENTKPTPRYRRGYSDVEILLNATKKQGGRGISPSKMVSMAKWIESNKKVNEVHGNIEKIEKKIIADIIKKSDVILATNSSAALEEIKDIFFDVAIIDEASQTTIPSVLIPIAKAHKFILAGDHKQLPPTVISKKASRLENTLFEKLIRFYPKKSKLLNIQYRMNKELMEFPNKTFYEGKLKGFNEYKLKDILDIGKLNNLNNLEKDLIASDKSLIFLDTSEIENNEEKQLKDSKSIINKCEANIVLDILDFFKSIGIKPEDIGVISPYLDQANLIKNKCEVEVKTVDGFQGREKEIIIISLVRSNNKNKIGFLKDLRRLNVSITRARRKLIIIGNSQTLKSNQVYNQLINHCWKSY